MNEVPHALRIARETLKTGGAAPSADEMRSYGDMLGKVRETRTGRTMGKYQTLPQHDAAQAMYSDLHGLAKEGEPGKMWYEKSSKRILDYFGGDKDKADKFAQLVAIYSPQTTVPINTQNAIKAYNRAQAGHPLWAGDIIDRDKSFATAKEANQYAQSLGGGPAGITRVPLDDSGKRYLIARHKRDAYENIATADRDLKAHLLMKEGIPFEGRKINNFYNNLMVHIDPKRLQGSTQDLWMAHAFGFPDDAVGKTQKYDYMEKMTEGLAKHLGWKPHQVQAAIWTAIKTRMEGAGKDAMREAVKRGLATMEPGAGGAPKFAPKPGMEDKISELHREMALGSKVSRQKIGDSARDFSDFLDQNLSHISWESAPSKRIAHLNGIEDLPPEAKAEYHGLISKALQDEKGNDVLAKYLGMMSPGSTDAPGYWEGKTNPVTNLAVGSTRIKGAGKAPDIDAPSKDLMDIYAAAKGLLHKQDAVGYHRPFYNPDLKRANGMEFDFDHDLEPHHIQAIGKDVDATVPGAAIIPVNKRKVRAVNFSHLHQDDQRGFHKAMTDVMTRSAPATHTYGARAFASDGNLVDNDWERHPNGEGYISRLSASKRPDVLRYVGNVLAPRVEAVDKSFAQKWGLKTDPRAEAAVRRAAAPQVVQPPAQGLTASPPTPALSRGGDVVGDAIRIARAEGGHVGIKLHVGPIHSRVSGRTDHLPVHVPSGAYVLPADIVSAMGEGNTAAGFEHIKRMFGGLPYHGRGNIPYGGGDGPYGSELPRKDGGNVPTGQPVACVLAGGEYVLSPDEVHKAGAGNMEAGHRALDAFVKNYRAKTISTLQKLPGPRRD